MRPAATPTKRARTLRFMLLSGMVAIGARAIPVLADEVAPADQMRHYWLREADSAWMRWKQAFETRNDPEATRAHYARLREEFIAAIGGFPERTPLNAHTTGVIERDELRVEKVVFESQPKFHVTANLYLPDPDRHPGRRPGVLVPCGHYQPAKAHDEYQSMGALLALNGMVALVYDPIEQGERLQSIDTDGKARFWGTSAHTLDDIQAMPLGHDVARTFIWDGMRGIDYLQSRPEVDPERIGITGNSGGGTQTSQLLALDGRIKAAAISCYISHLNSQIHVSPGDGEQNIFGALSIGPDHPDFLLMRAPTPVKLLAATHDFFDINATWETFRLAKRAYTRLGFSERVEILENDAGHNFNRTQREAAARWFARWLLGEERGIREPDRVLFTQDELRCTPRGQVMLMPGARSIRDLFREDADRATAVRAKTWPMMNPAERRDAVRRTAVFRAMDDLPAAEWTLTSTHSDAGCRVEAWQVRLADGGVTISARWFEPDQPNLEPVIVIVSSDGFEADSGPDGRLGTLAKAGRRILALDVRGTGATRQRNQQGAPAPVGRDYVDVYSAYMLGRSYVGIQTEDVLTAVHEALRRSEATQVDLLATGGVSVPALHAAFSNPDAFRSVSLENMVASWDSVVRADKTYGQFMNAVHGALQIYDLPDLVASLGSAITIRNPTEPTGVVRNPLPPSPEDLVPSRSGLIGVQFGSPKFVNPQATDLLASGTTRWGTDHGHDWSAHWTGFLVPTISGEIEFAIETNEEATVRVAGQTAATTPPSAGDRPTPVKLKAGEAVPIEIDFNKPRRESELESHVSNLAILWLDRDGEWYPVPDSWLRHSRAQEDTEEMSLR